MVQLDNYDSSRVTCLKKQKKDEKRSYIHIQGSEEGSELGTG